MKTINASQIIAIPKGVKVDVAARQVTVTGPRGTLKKDFRHLQIDMIKIGGKRLKVEMWWGKHKQIAAVRTACSHIENMILGVTKGYRYKMRFVYAHFPINAAIVNDGKTIEIRNFLGEKEVRKVTVYDGVILTRSEDVKDEIVLTGNDVEAVSQSAANIHQSTLVRDKDIRKFLDGIYVSEGGVIEN